jgi:hypothetical protein
MIIPSPLTINLHMLQYKTNSEVYMYSNRKRQLQRILTLFVFIPLLGACNLPAASDSTPDPDAVGTAAAQTVAVQMQELTATAAASTPIPLFSLTPTLADLVLTPTITVASGLKIKANADINCREGPDTGYRIIGMLQTNQEANVRGRNADSSWWYIDFPNTPGSSCWVSGSYTTVLGDPAGIPVVTALPLPPTVAPTYGGVNASVEYIVVVPCGNDTGMVTFFAENIGSVELKSMELTIRDIQEATILYSGIVNSPFMPWLNDCAGSTNLLPEKTAYFGGIIQPPIMWKHRGRAIIQLCSDYNAQGECSSFRIEFYFTQ